MDKVVIITLYVFMLLSGLVSIDGKNNSSVVVFVFSSLLLVGILHLIGVF